MITTLLQLTVQGTLALGVVWLCDLWLGRRMQARWRRCWWVALPLFFLIPWELKVLPESAPKIVPEVPVIAAEGWPTVGAAIQVPQRGTWADAVVIIWMLGALVSLIVIVAQTRKASQQWAGLRLSTDSRLLELLEDAKEQAGVRAPIGLVVSPQIGTPAILGWLRPRILLPAGLTDKTALRHVMLHELAHFRGADIPIGWLYALVRCVHWFNPLAYGAERAWTCFREEAADEAAMRSLDQPAAYGETLLKLADEAQAAPCGALGIGESFFNLKTRITKIMNHHKRTPHTILAFVVLTALTAVLTLRAGEEDPKTAAVAAMEVWLKGIDAGKYAESWDEASPLFQKSITSEGWVAALKAVRGPVGQCEQRKLASAAYQTEVPLGAKVLKGEYVIAQFDTSFADMKYTIETVTFEKVDGKWKASGYFIKPK